MTRTRKDRMKNVESLSGLANIRGHVGKLHVNEYMKLLPLKYRIGNDNSILAFGLFFMILLLY